MSARRLVILACSATKRSDPGYIPAVERYDGPLWQTFRAARAEGATAACAFVSGYYGFGRAELPIMNYNHRLTPSMARELIAHGLDKKWPLPPSKTTPPTWGHWPDQEIGMLSDWRKRPFVDVALVGGELYLEVMRAFVEQFRTAGHVTADARITEINAPIGYMRQQLRQWLAENPGEVAPLEPGRAAVTPSQYIPNVLSLNLVVKKVRANVGPALM